MRVLIEWKNTRLVKMAVVLKLVQLVKLFIFEKKIVNNNSIQVLEA